MATVKQGTISTAPVSGSGLSDQDLLDMYRQMVLVRTLDERIWMLNRQGKAAIVASSQGHEAGQIGSVWALERGVDQFYIYYRDLAVMLTLGMTPVEIMSGFLAKEGEPLSGARQFPTHGAYPELGIVNLSNVVGTHIPQAVGVALAMKMRGDPRPGHRILRGRRVECRRLPRGDELRGDSQPAGNLFLREQQVRDLGTAGQADGR